MKTMAGQEALIYEKEKQPEKSYDWQSGWPQTIDEFERLVDKFQNYLVRFAFRRLGNMSDAEDVAQEVFVRAYADRARRADVANVSPYLYRMASNLCADLLRKRQYGAMSIDDAKVVEIPSPNQSPLDETAAAEELRKINNSLAELPEEQAEVIRLHFFDELKLTDIAEMFGSPLPTIKSRLRYGLEKLRENLLSKERKS